MRWSWVLALIVCACGHAKPRTGVLTDELIPHIAELGREGQAQLPTVVETGGIEGDLLTFVRQKWQEQFGLIEVG